MTQFRKPSQRKTNMWFINWKLSHSSVSVYPDWTVCKQDTFQCWVNVWHPKSKNKVASEAAPGWREGVVSVDRPSEMCVTKQRKGGSGGMLEWGLEVDWWHEEATNSLRDHTVTDAHLTLQQLERKSSLSLLWHTPSYFPTHPRCKAPVHIYNEVDGRY